MFNIFKNNQREYFDKAFAALDKKWFEGVVHFRSRADEMFRDVEKKFKDFEVMPIVTQSDDLVTVTFKGPNCTTTVTAKQANLPDVLKQFGLEMPAVAKAKKPVTKKKSV